MGKNIPGKLRLDAHITLVPSETKIDAEVYIHLKGYARARVSHLDVEKTGLGKVIRRGRGNFLEIMGVESGLEVVLRKMPDNFGRRRIYGFKHRYSQFLA